MLLLIFCKKKRWKGYLCVSDGAHILCDGCVSVHTRVGTVLASLWPPLCASVNYQVKNKDSLIFMLFSSNLSRGFVFISPHNTTGVPKYSGCLWFMHNFKIGPIQSSINLFIYLSLDWPKYQDLRQKSKSLRLLHISYTMHYFSITNKCNITQVCGEEGASASSALCGLALGHYQKDKVSNEKGWNDFAVQGDMTRP